MPSLDSVLHRMGDRPEISYVALIFLLFVLPKMLLRLRVPAAITSLALGAVAGMGFGLLQHDTTLGVLSTLGIVALFLFAGLEVDVPSLRRDAPVLLQHLAVRIALMLVVGWLVHAVGGLDVRVSALVALAVLTPSTGFILDSLGGYDIGARERGWIKSKAIATELLALGVLFVTLQSTTWQRLVLAMAVMAALVLVVPLAFRLFARLVVPHAPRSEFAFLLMVAVVAAYVTRELGVYYLVGAFMVGMAAQRFRARLPSMASEEMLRAVELFASFFVPFYFFSAGLHLEREHFSPQAIGVGLALVAVAVPLRITAVAVHRRLALGEPIPAGLRIALPMLPTLVFGLVLAEILRDRFDAPPALFGGLVLHTLVVTLLPSFLMRNAPSTDPAPLRHGPGAPLDPDEGAHTVALAEHASGAVSPGGAQPR